MLLPQQLERDTGLLQLVVNILVVDGRVYSFFLKLLRKEQRVDLIVIFVGYVLVADAQLSSSIANCCDGFG